MSEKSIKFEDKKINKSSFYKSKKLFKINGIHVDKTLISKKGSYGRNKTYKYHIVYNYNDEIKPVFIRLPQMIEYLRCFDSSKTMSFKVNDQKLLKSYSKIWEKISNLVDKKFDSEVVYGDSDKYIKAKIKPFEDTINTIFHNNKTPKQNVS